MMAGPLAPLIKKAPAATEALSENSQHTNHTPLANLVQFNLDGRRRAQDFIFELTRESDLRLDPDALFIELGNFISFTNMQERVILRGFCHAIQRALDRGQQA